jgi:hypothetical protein
MRLSFVLSKSDLTALHKIINRRLTALSGANSKLFFSNLFVWLPIGIAIATYGALYRKYPELSDDLTVVALAFSCGVALLVAAIFYKQHLYRNVMLSEHSWFLAPQTFELGPESLNVEGSYGSANYRWTSFIHYEEDNLNLYLFIDNAQALVLPKTAIGSSEQLSQIKSWLAAGALTQP